MKLDTFLKIEIDEIKNILDYPNLETLDISYTKQLSDVNFEKYIKKIKKLKSVFIKVKIFENEILKPTTFCSKKYLPSGIYIIFQILKIQIDNFSYEIDYSEVYPIDPEPTITEDEDQKSIDIRNRQNYIRNYDINFFWSINKNFKKIIYSNFNNFIICDFEIGLFIYNLHDVRCAQKIFELLQIKNPKYILFLDTYYRIIQLKDYFDDIKLNFLGSVIECEVDEVHIDKPKIKVEPYLKYLYPNIHRLKFINFKQILLELYGTNDILKIFSLNTNLNFLNLF